MNLTLVQITERETERERERGMGERKIKRLERAREKDR